MFATRARAVLRNHAAITRSGLAGRRLASSAPAGVRVAKSHEALAFGAALAAMMALTPLAMISGKTELDARLPTSGDIISTGTPVKEPSTGILFPQLCNGFFLVGTGVRVKYGFVKVYAVGSYMDPLAMSAAKKNPAATQEALLDPTYPRTIRIVMNRGLSVKKFTDGMVESIKPRLKGQDLDKLDEFIKLNPPVDLVQGAEIEITIRGDMLLYKNAVGGVGTIRSEAFTRAMCDVYYGSDPVSPTHKQAVLAGIPKL